MKHVLALFYILGFLFIFSISETLWAQGASDDPKLTTLTLQQQAALYFWLECYLGEDEVLREASLRALIQWGAPILPFLEKKALDFPSLQVLIQEIQNPQMILLQDLEKRADSDLQKELSQYRQREQQMEFSWSYQQVPGLFPLSVPLFVEYQYFSQKELKKNIAQQVMEHFRSQGLYPLVSKSKAQFILVPSFQEPQVEVLREKDSYWKGEVLMDFTFYDKEQKKRLKTYTIRPQLTQAITAQSSRHSFMNALLSKGVEEFLNQLSVEKQTLKVSLFYGEKSCYERGVYWLISQQPEKALLFYKQLAPESPDDLWYFHQGVAYEVLGRFSEALTQYRYAFNKAPQEKIYQEAVQRCQEWVSSF
jgi:tetratricopeptide (TPR) repeat protein